MCNLIMNGDMFVLGHLSFLTAILADNKFNFVILVKLVKMTFF